MYLISYLKLVQAQRNRIAINLRSLTMHPNQLIDCYPLKKITAQYLKKGDDWGINKNKIIFNLIFTINYIKNMTPSLAIFYSYNIS